MCKIVHKRMYMYRVDIKEWPSLFKIGPNAIEPNDQMQ